MGNDANELFESLDFRAIISGYKSTRFATKNALVTDSF